MLVAPTSKTIVFRCDAALFMGNGHLVRCLTLAKAYANVGFKSAFVCRNFDGHLGHVIKKDGHDLWLLPEPSTKTLASIASGGSYRHWLGADFEKDAEQTRAIIDKIGAARVVVDHYAIDEKWSKLAVPNGTPVLVIDDLANRKHVCDVLLDQNLGRQANDYDGLVPASSLRLIGPKYSVLKPEFARNRQASLARRADPELHNILVSMGGVDADNVTAQVFETLKDVMLPKGTKITAVLGPSAPHLHSVQTLAETMPYPCGVLKDVTDMASLMASSDLAIGAMGATSWERCCVGLPTLALSIADNQHGAALALEASGAGLLLGNSNDREWTEKLRFGIEKAKDPRILSSWSKCAATVCDGAGTERIIANLMPEFFE